MLHILLWGVWVPMGSLCANEETKERHPYPARPLCIVPLREGGYANAPGGLLAVSKPLLPSCLCLGRGVTGTHISSHAQLIM